MSIYCNKEGLYKEIDSLKNYLGIDLEAYKLNMVDICKKRGILVEQIPFKTIGLRGIASIGSPNSEDVILVNSNKSELEQNFICAHEIVHLKLHRNEDRQEFNCFDEVQPSQNKFLEWQANEGAAEMITPYRAILPIIRFYYQYWQNENDIIEFKKRLAAAFQVTVKVIEFRLESLKYEIDQHVRGVEIDKIRILSISQQKKENLNIKSVNDMQNDYVAERLERIKGMFI